MPPIRSFRIALLALVFAPIAAPAQPALWIAQSATATNYLFGTMHALPKGTDWHFPALDRALVASQSLYVEEDDASRAEITALILKEGISRPDLRNVKSMLNFHSVYPEDLAVYANPYVLSGELAAPDREKFRAAANHADVTGGLTMVQAMKPWLAALILANAAVRRTGFKPTFGADLELEREFRTHHKPVHAFETAQQQIALFANTPRSVQLEMLQAVLGDPAQRYVPVTQLSRDWLSGNTATIASALNGGMREHYPALYEVLVVDRNCYFAQRIAGLLNRHGTFFVAIGAAHLAGPDSVRARLATLGITSRRVH